MARYIDADALITLVEKRLKNSVIIGWLCSIIGEVPTIEVRPVVRGEWLGDRGGYTCSNCGGDAPDESYWPSPFCAACGADMRGEENG